MEKEVENIVKTLTERIEKSDIERYWPMFFINQFTGNNQKEPHINAALLILLSRKLIKKAYYFWVNSNECYLVSVKEYKKAVKDNFWYCRETGYEVENFKERFSVVYLVPAK